MVANQELRGHRIKRTPSVKRRVAEVPKLISFLFTLNETFIKWTPSVKRSSRSPQITLPYLL